MRSVRWGLVLIYLGDQKKSSRRSKQASGSSSVSPWRSADNPLQILG
jgi:hypothetical protein